MDSSWAHQCNLLVGDYLTHSHYLRLVHGQWQSVSLAHPPSLESMLDTMQLAVLHVLHVERSLPNSSTGAKSGTSLETAGHVRSSTMVSRICRRAD